MPRLTQSLQLLAFAGALAARGALADVCSSYQQTVVEDYASTEVDFATCVVPDLDTAQIIGISCSSDCLAFYANMILSLPDCEYPTNGLNFYNLSNTWLDDCTVNGVDLVTSTASSLSSEATTETASGSEASSAEASSSETESPATEAPSSATEAPSSTTETPATTTKPSTSTNTSSSSGGSGTAASASGNGASTVAVTTSIAVAAAVVALAAF